ncbi:hypothetical protein P4V37_15550 [Bacillus subtilis]|uniref:DUF6973 domain-containing protein n=1 Tax=Bacillus TaxID=1386 RepID=UPI0005B7039F|nr:MULTISPECIES: hypothetical protein [Bacillus]MBW4825184.1 hypothetical protein [Bacillaceae bacterium]KIO57890.1 hypothetical protein B4143_3900 [Bacillus subtilis]KMY46710.1 hypothetical protein AC621_00540 [Bacillus sp. FJAT-27445]MBG9805463.1 hypothetical protein [Bacillus subtilis]MBG9807432.1 hypothetical protein [Bacillus subtilis]
MKKSIILLSSVVISATIFTSSTALAKEYSPDKLQYSKTEHTKKNKLYLTEQELRNTDFNMLSKVNDQLEKKIANKNYTEEELNQIAAKAIQQAIQNKSTSFSAMDYSIPGFGALTDAEIRLAKSNPLEFVKYGNAAQEAKAEAEKYYGKEQLGKGNGDAFRHSYWNARLVQSFGGGPSHGYNRAKVWATAHESKSSGLDKQMDLMNNETGRFLATENYYTYSSVKYSSVLRSMVKQGSLVRIVNGKLVATNGTTGK